MKKQISLICGMVLGFCSSLQAEDIELYTGSEDAINALAPKVFLVLDTSGSMNEDFIGFKQHFISDEELSATPGLRENNNYVAEYQKYREFIGSAVIQPGEMGIDDDGNDFIYYSLPRDEKTSPYNGLYGKSVQDILNVVDTNPVASLVDVSSKNRFNRALLNCETAIESLRNNGFFTGYLRNYEYTSGNVGKWKGLPKENGQSQINAVDCYEDVYFEKGNNKYSITAGDIQFKYKKSDGTIVNSLKGYPADGESVPYNTDGSRASRGLRTGQLVTIYDANYLRWAAATVKSGMQTENTTRIKVAKRTLQRIISSSPMVNYGLMRFNSQSSHVDKNGLRAPKSNGGEIVFNISKPEEVENKDDRLARQKLLLDIIKSNDYINAGGNTPLAESLYEGLTYLEGTEPRKYPKKEYSMYGEIFSKRVSSIHGDYTDFQPYKPFYWTNTSKPKQTADGKYRSPYSAACDDHVNVVLLTDGEPNADSDSRTFFETLASTADSKNDYKKYLFTRVKRPTNYCKVISGRRCVEYAEYEDKFTCENADTRNEWLNNRCYIEFDRGVNNSKYIPFLAHKISSTADFNTDLDKNQKSKVFVVSYADGVDDLYAKDMLKVSGALGGGGFIDANDEAKLTAALQAATLTTGATSASFSTPASVTSTDRTRSDKNVYFSQFVPSDSPRWSGNLRQYKIEKIDVGGEQVYSIVGELGGKFVPATDENNVIKSSVRDYWSSESTDELQKNLSDDEKDIKKEMLGGVQQALTNQSDRTLLFENPGRKELIEVSKSGTTVTVDDLKGAYGSTGYQNAFKVGTEADATNLVEWVAGVQSGTSGTKSIRRDIFGDPLHSQPIVVNYGTRDKKQSRVLIGTNHGVFHMFEKPESSSSALVKEKWVFLPKDLLGNIKTLEENIKNTPKVYGLDAPPALFLLDLNGDGLIDPTVSQERYYIDKDGKKGSETVNERAIAYIGMRRGGRNYYALDVSNASQPKLLWTIKGGQGNEFHELGQTWAKPAIGQIKVQIDGATRVRDALFFSAGYDPATKDDDITERKPDQMGRGMFIVDALTGKLIWKVSPRQWEADGKTTKPTTDTEKTAYYNGVDSVPADLIPFDSNFDGIIDRIYFADTGGSIWRVDMPSHDKSRWSVIHFADLAGQEKVSGVKPNGDPTSWDNNIRFYHAPDIARGYLNRVASTGSTPTDTKRFNRKRPYEAIVIGSGNRSHPLSLKMENSIFVLRDFNVVTRSYKNAKGTGNLSSQPKTIKLADLHENTVLAERGICGFNKTLTEQNDNGECVVGSGSGSSVTDTGTAKGNLNAHLARVASRSGWYLKLKNKTLDVKSGNYLTESGEKVLSQPLILNGVVYVNTYIPEDGIVGKKKIRCGPANGQSRNYRLSLDYGYKLGSKSYVKIGNSLVGGVGAIATGDGLGVTNASNSNSNNVTKALTTGAIERDENGDVLKVPRKKAGLRTFRNYMYQKEK